MYLRSKSRSLVRFTAIVAVLGITVGVAALILAQALARGFQDEMRDKILSNTAHITAFRNDGRPIKDHRSVINELERLENVRLVTPTTYESAILIGAKANSYAVLRVAGSRKPGVDVRAADAENRIEVRLGAELAEKTGLNVGDTAEIVVTSAETAMNSAVRIGETFRTGLYDYDSSWIYILPEDYAKLFNYQNFHPTVLSISVDDVYKADATAEQVRRTLSADYRTVDWQEANRPLFAALSLEKRVSLAIISLIIFIAVLNITTNLSLLVNERRLDIAVLRTCGAATRSLLSIFVLEGLLLGVIGIILGVLSGTILSLAGNYFRLIRLDSAVYSLDSVPFHPHFTDIFLIAAIAFLLSFLATIYPAWRAARQKPLENLRIQ